MSSTKVHACSWFMKMHFMLQRIFQQRFVHSSFRRSVAGIPEMVRAVMHLGRRSSGVGLPGSAWSFDALMAQSNKQTWAPA